MNKAIVITTINYPSKAVIKFSKIKNFELFVVGDNKTPKDWNLINTTFLPIEKQFSKYDKLSKLIAQNHYARKNLGYVEAIKSGSDFIYETDDDNMPYDFFPNFIDKSQKINQITSNTAFNIYSLFTKKNIWPRGLPLKYIKNNKYKVCKIEIKPLIQQSLANLDPDVDAIYRLCIYDKINFIKGKRFMLDKHVYCPFNSQNTYWDKQVFTLLYLPSTVESRVTDIWRGYIAQRILWKLNSRLIFSSPSVYQERNIHDFMKDFYQEYDLYNKSELLIKTLESIELEGTISDMMLKIYKKLISLSFFEKKEIYILKEWLRQISN